MFSKANRLNADPAEPTGLIPFLMKGEKCKYDTFNFFCIQCLWQIHQGGVGHRAEKTLLKSPLAQSLPFSLT